MKLAIVIPGFQAGPDDWCIPAFTNLARELARVHEVHVFALRYPARRETYKIGDVTVHAIGGGAISGRRLPVLSLLRLWVDTLNAVRSEHRKSPFGAVLGIWATESGWLTTSIAALLGLPSVVHLAGGELAWLPEIGYGNAGGGLASWLVRGTLRRTTLLTVPSLPVRHLAERNKVAAGKLRSWPLGVDTSMFSPEARPADDKQPGPFAFATAGSLIPVKDHELLIKAFAHLRAAVPGVDVTLKIAGDGPLRAHLLRLVDALNLRGYVAIDGELLHDALPDFYRSADCFVLPSHYEAQCMAALEAMACGVPWVGFPVGALADLSRQQSGEQASGFLVEQRTLEALADAMLSMLTLPAAARHTMGQNARRAALDHYALDRQVAELDAFLQQLTASATVAKITTAYP